MRDFIRKPRNWLLVMVVLAVAISLIFTFTSSFSSNLPSYNGPNENLEPAPDAPKEPASIPTVSYTSEDYGFQMDVPDGWVYAVRSGGDSFTNQIDGANISFHVGEYDPTQYWVSEESITAEVTSAGGVVGSFSWLSNSSYAAVYAIGDTDYFELTTWDLDMMVRVSIQTPAIRYSDYRDDMLALLDTFSWAKSNPVPDGYYMYYNEIGSMEFPIPDGWGYEIDASTSSLVAYSEDGISLRVTVTPAAGDLSDLSQTDYYNIMCVGKTDYMQTAYNNSGTLLTAEATFTNSGIPYMESHNILIYENYQYELLLQCPTSLLEQGRQYNETISKYFRIF